MSSATTPRIGFDSGRTSDVNSRRLLAPSIRAASISSRGIESKYRFITRMLNAPAACGSQTAQKVFCRFTPEHRHLEDGQVQRDQRDHAGQEQRGQHRAGDDRSPLRPEHAQHEGARRTDEQGGQQRADRDDRGVAQVRADLDAGSRRSGMFCHWIPLGHSCIGPCRMSWLVDRPDFSNQSSGPTPAMTTPMNSSTWIVGRPYRISDRCRSAVEMMPRSSPRPHALALPGRGASPGAGDLFGDRETGHVVLQRRVRKW